MLPVEASPKPNYDIVLFIGMAQGRSFYTLETRAHRDGYVGKDEEGKNMVGDRYWEEFGAPEILRTGFEGDEVWRGWKKVCMVSRVPCLIHWLAGWSCPCISCSSLREIVRYAGLEFGLGARNNR